MHSSSWALRPAWDVRCAASADSPLHAVYLVDDRFSCERQIGLGRYATAGIHNQPQLASGSGTRGL